MMTIIIRKIRKANLLRITLYDVGTYSYCSINYFTCARLAIKHNIICFALLKPIPYYTCTFHMPLRTYEMHAFCCM